MKEDGFGWDREANISMNMRKIFERKEKISWDGSSKEKLKKDLLIFDMRIIWLIMCLFLIQKKLIFFT